MKRQGGFTMVELIMVMVMVGVLAAIGIPKLMGGNTTGALVFGDQVASALRHAQTSAVSHRRVVCLATTARTLVMRIRTATSTTTELCTAAFGPLLQRADNDTYDSSRSEEHTSELQSPSVISYAVFCLRSEERRVEIGRAHV